MKASVADFRVRTHTRYIVRKSQRGTAEKAVPLFLFVLLELKKIRRLAIQEFADLRDIL